MATYEMTNGSIEPYINLYSNSLTTYHLKTDDIKTDEVISSKLNITDTAFIDKLNYNSIYSNGIKLKLNPLYLVQSFDSSFQFISLYYLNFEQPSSLSTNYIADVKIEKQIFSKTKPNGGVSYTPIYKYVGDISMKINMDLSLTYQFVSDHAPRYAIKIYLNGGVIRSMQCGVSDSVNELNSINISYLLDVIKNDEITIAIIKDPTDTATAYTLFKNSFLCFKQV